jgi:hypothetical protein
LKVRTIAMNKPKSEQGERQTEDETARTALGGVKGFPEGKPVPLTKQEDEQMLPNNDPGHVA